MPVPLDPGDRKLLIISGSLLVLIVIGTVLFTAPPEEPWRGFPSSYSAASDGAKAAYLLLGELGYGVERWARSPADLPAPPEAITLILADPVIPPSAEERAALSRFVITGGRVIATGDRGARVLPEADLQSTKKLVAHPQNFRAQIPSRLSRHAPEITMETQARWGSKYPHHVAHYADSAGGTVVRYGLGQGEIVWWADSSPLTNYGLTQASNLMLFLNSVGARGDRHVLWDEYFHGQRPGLASYLGRTPLPWAALQLGVLAGVVLLSFSRRSGPTRPVVKAGLRFSPLEFVETVGELYERKAAAAGALEVAYHRFRFLLLRRLGLPEASAAEAVARGVQERLVWAAPGLEETLRQSELALKSSSLREAEALRLIGELHYHAQRLRLSGRPRGE